MSWHVKLGVNYYRWVSLQLEFDDIEEGRKAGQQQTQHYEGAKGGFAPYVVFFYTSV